MSGRPASGQAEAAVNSVNAIESLSAGARSRIFRILCRLAASDEEIHPRERDVLEDARVALELSPADAVALACEAPHVKLRIGPTREEHEVLVQLMIAIVAADGELAEEERKRLVGLARVIGLELDELERRLASAMGVQTGEAGPKPGEEFGSPV